MANESGKLISRGRKAAKKRKASQTSKPTRAGRHSSTDSKETKAPQGLSLAERKILVTFREYLIAPGEMLCFGIQDVNAIGAPLDTLTDRGLLMAERSHGGYSLTEIGYAAMRAVV
jgi:hypothetical protein